MIDGIPAGKDNTMNAALEIEENPPIEEHKIVYDSQDMDEISAGMDNAMNATMETKGNPPVERHDITSDSHENDLVMMEPPNINLNELGTGYDWPSVLNMF